MKKKIYKFVSVAVIAVAMVVSFQMSKEGKISNVSLDKIISNALADTELPGYPGETWYRFGVYSEVTITETTTVVVGGFTQEVEKTYTVYDCVGFFGDC